MIEILVWMIIGGLVGYLCGQARGRVAEGVAIGIVFGPLGWLIMLCAKDQRYRCPDCKSLIIEGARLCAHCGCPFEWFEAGKSSDNTLENYKRWKKSRPPETKIDSE